MSNCVMVLLTIGGVAADGHCMEVEAQGGQVPSWLRGNPALPRPAGLACAASSGISSPSSLHAGMQTHWDAPGWKLLALLVLARMSQGHCRLLSASSGCLSHTWPRAV